MSLKVLVKKRIGGFSLDVSLESAGGTVSVLGFSGCGKTTLLRCIAGLLKPDSGEIVLNGRVLYSSRSGVDVAVRERKVGYVFQQYALFPEMTVAENVRTGFRCAPGFRSLAKAERDGMVREHMDRFGLSGLGDRLPRQLSGGQRQRAAIARCMASGPDLLLFDEPFSSLDGYASLRMQDEVRGYLDAFGKDAVFVSHNVDEVGGMGGNVALMEAGRCDGAESLPFYSDNPGTYRRAVLLGYRRFVPVADGSFLAVRDRDGREVRVTDDRGADGL